MKHPDPLAATVREIRAGVAALDACRLLCQWAADNPDPDREPRLAVAVRAAEDALLAALSPTA